MTKTTDQELRILFWLQIHFILRAELGGQQEEIRWKTCYSVSFVIQRLIHHMNQNMCHTGSKSETKTDKVNKETGDRGRDLRNWFQWSRPTLLTRSPFEGLRTCQYSSVTLKVTVPLIMHLIDENWGQQAHQGPSLEE